MEQQFFFMFSSGYYSDYSVGALCVCDHEVSEKEWDEHYAKYQALSMAFLAGLEAAPGNMTTDQYVTWREWRTDNAPEKTFMELHGMTYVPVSEFWRDS